MHALVRTDEATMWMDVAAPRLDPGHVLVRVSLVGLCRTDLAVASGALPVDTPRILGHEFVGEVIAIGPAVKEVRTGEDGVREISAREICLGGKVSADPVLRCGRCERCTRGWHHACIRSRFMGVDVDGAIAEQIVIPVENVWPLPDSLDDRVGALLEPVAACAAVLKAPIDVRQRGVILGSGRLSRLTEMILRSRGFVDVHCFDPMSQPMRTDEYDFAIDTEGSTASVAQLAAGLRPAGVLVLKSRPLHPVALDLRGLLPKEPRIHLVNYADFADARQLLLDPEIDYQSLTGPVWSSVDFADALEAAAGDESRKHYLEPMAVELSASIGQSGRQCVR